MTLEFIKQFESEFQHSLSTLLVNNATLRVALAFSGGLDSTALLSLLEVCKSRLSIEVVVFHVNHGISKNADRWQQHCQHLALSKKFEFDSCKLSLDLKQYGGLEAIAREARYQALGAMCRKHKIDVLLTAHHQDDQVETGLMNLFNGAGVFGMAGMEAAKSTFGLLRNEQVAVLRPLINFSRKELTDYLSQTSYPHIEDESNHDLKFKRNLLRNRVIPQLEQELPGLSNRLIRSISHMQSAKRLLIQLGESDFQVAKGRLGLVIVKLRQFSSDRLDNLLRYWMDRHHLSMPSLAQLTELKKQILTSRSDAQVEIHIQGVSFYLETGELVLVPRIADQHTFDLQRTEFVWRGESEIEFPAFFGRLQFVPAKYGLSLTMLQERPLSLHFRQGGERISLGPNRPGRELKKQYQALDIPYWQRRRLPLVTRGERLLFAAGLGVNAKFAVDTQDAIQLIWKSDLLHRE